ncbi:cytochrome P450 [Saccharothrix violaceirubra]|uniref:Cytochrome P450 n=1 Tax=Saccharothrix violaceirubra TaxID=413306 RepID=A0A7W7T327_9PSEU|nr:cytochrome P450 [Saccharothrix violaceirubra]MBB4965692.1 cytochrome P450 [Saccharothrix violaceirubra]
MSDASDKHYLDLLESMTANPGDGVFRRGRGQVFVMDADLARAVLRNDGDRYVDHSDFFYSRTTAVTDRDAQVALGRAGRAFLQDFVDRSRSRLPSLVDRCLRERVPWPDAANLLLLRYFADAFAGEPNLRVLVADIVRRGVRVRGPERHDPVSRAWFRRRVGRALRAALVRASDDELLGVLARAAPGEPPAALAEVYLSFLFATVGATGFLLAWSVYLLGEHPDQRDRPPSWVVRESLRLWPVAWAFGRKPRHPHRLGAERVTVTDEVVACPYLVHRDPRQWPDADEFRPDRWSGQVTGGFIPFGHGPHACTGAGLATGLVEELVGLLHEGRDLVVTSRGVLPRVGASLAPPEFTVTAVRTATPVGRR